MINTSYILIFLAVMVLVIVFTRLRGRRRTLAPEMGESGPRIKGFQITAYLHPHIGTQCLFDDGIQFGPGFRRKEGPALPHDDRCRCRARPFSYSSGQVFKGALRDMVENESTIPGLPPLEVSRLIGRLREVEENAPPDQLSDYINKINVEAFPARHRKDIENFLKERHDFILNRGRGSLTAQEGLHQDQPPAGEKPMPAQDDS